ncbi:MAG TPA: hypothetical protein VLE27_16680 [Thermoanaerobaculia bacterium]|nr:hypothetical protein [Thermoanaerobaculia bacterium]
MGDCTAVGFSGTDGFQFGGQNLLPSGSICTLSGFTQSSNTQTVTVKNSTGTVVAQISGNGGLSGTPQPMTGNTSFTADGKVYMLYFGNSGGQSNRVLYQASDIPDQSTATTYTFFWNFITEDTPSGGDCDFNDATVTLFWNLKKG